MFYLGKPVSFVHYYPYHRLVNQLLVERDRFRCWWKWSSRSTWLSKWIGRRRVSAPGDFLQCQWNPRSGSSRATSASSSASSSAYVWKNISECMTMYVSRCILYVRICIVSLCVYMYVQSCTCEYYYHQLCISLLQ